jgi:hypothetical protein
MDFLGLMIVFALLLTVFTGFLEIVPVIDTHLAFLFSW